MATAVRIKLKVSASFYLSTTKWLMPTYGMVEQVVPRKANMVSRASSWDTQHIRMIRVLAYHHHNNN